MAHALPHRARPWLGLTGALALAAAALAGCSKAPAEPAATVAGSAAASAATAPVAVTAATVQQRDFAVQVDANGTVTAVRSVDVRPQVTATITRVAVREGQHVERGELLFLLDDRTPAAAVAQARAQLAKDQASLADARRQLERNRALLAQSFISQGTVDTSLALAETQQAAVNASRAALTAAQVNLADTRITAPAAGRIGAIGIYPGSSVQANQTTLLTITQLAPIQVAFSLPQRYLPDALAALRSATAAVQAAVPAAPSATGSPAGAATVPQAGRIVFVDNAVDGTTGTVRVKAEFPNEGERLWPGAFVPVTMTAGTLPRAIVMPLAALIDGARGTVAYVIEGQVAQSRPVEVLATQGPWAAVKGLRAGERVAVEGRQNLRPGSSVVERTAAGTGSPASAASAAQP